MFVPSQVYNIIIKSRGILFFYHVPLTMLTSILLTSTVFFEYVFVFFVVSCEVKYFYFESGVDLPAKTGLSRTFQSLLQSS